MSAPTLPEAATPTVDVREGTDVRTLSQAHARPGPPLSTLSNRKTSAFPFHCGGASPQPHRERARRVGCQRRRLLVRVRLASHSRHAHSHPALGAACHRLSHVCTGPGSATSRARARRVTLCAVQTSRACGARGSGRGAKSGTRGTCRVAPVSRIDDRILGAAAGLRCGGARAFCCALAAHGWRGGLGAYHLV